MVTAVWSFALVAGLVTMTPGIDTALVLRTAASRARVAAFAAAAGISVGCVVWGVAAALGVSALLTASTLAFDVLRIVGAGYMLFLGVRMIVSAFRAGHDAPITATEDVAGPGEGWGPYFRQGLLTNLLNPKVGAFYVALLPQFIPADQAPAAGALLALVHGVEGLLWFTALILLVDRMSAWLRGRTVRRTVDAVAGLTVIGFGVRLATTRA